MDDAQLRTVWQQRRPKDHAVLVGQPLADLMKDTLAKRVKQLGRLSAVWDELIPQSIAEHTALESFKRGVLTVLVDSSAHRYQLRTLLDGGLLGQLRARFNGSLNKVHLSPGQFYAVDLSGDCRYSF